MKRVRDQIREYREFKADRWELEETKRLRHKWRRLSRLTIGDNEMAELLITPNLEEDPWPEPVDLEGVVDAVGGLPHGTGAGKPAVALRVRLSDGRLAVVQTSLNSLLKAADALWLAYGASKRKGGG
jgi:hypothetical protein